jgi:cytochrome c553
MRRQAWSAFAAGALCALAATSAAAAPLEIPDTIAQRVQACTACHGEQGRATNQGYFPRIAGKPAGYLYNQLVNFRDGRRNNAAMNTLVANMSDDYLHEIANYFGTLELPYPPPGNHVGLPQDLARGFALVTRGDAQRRIPACVQCHGDSMTGVAPGVPGLLGLPRDYLVGQLGAWRSGQRKAVAPDCMGQIANRLSVEDVNALTSWLSAQPVPKDSKPAPATGQPLPMTCGSGSK